MKKTKKKVMKNPQHLKQKLMGALSMVLVTGVLLTTVSFAWLVMSIAPEVRGISTNIGANGSLEIALLTTETKQDLSSIKSGTVGQSLAKNDTSANNTWGNLLDVSSKNYGLDEIVLMPSRINVDVNGDGSYTVPSSMLSVPTYGYDGRIVDLTDNTISSIYNGKTFEYKYGVQDYGVRAIGTSESITVQGSALATAKANVVSYRNSANSTSASTWQRNGAGLFQMILNHAMDADKTFTDEDLKVLKSMVNDLRTSVDYIDLSIRYGIVAVGASAIDDETTFDAFQKKVLDTNKELSVVLTELGEYEVTVPSQVTEWADKLAVIDNNLNSAETECNKLTDGVYTWAEIKAPMNYIVVPEMIYIEGAPFSDLSGIVDDLMVKDALTISLSPGSGAFADIADFAGNINTTFTAISKAMTVETLSAQNPFYLVALENLIKDLNAAGGAASGKPVEMSTIYGYALDLAFRCNVAGVTNLLLQTTPAQRVYDDSSSASTLGGGSYMEFTTGDATLDTADRLKLMDAVRVAFVDDQGNLLGVAKLNMSNRDISDGSIKAPLYLYDFSFDENGAMVMGERQKANNIIMSLEKNVAKSVTAMVWLDGDLVDNTMVSAEETSLGGTLNLQFASDADLIPAGNDDLKALTADKTGLKAAIEAEKATFEAGNDLKYTAVTWDAYVVAYNYAVSVSNDITANDGQIALAERKLAEAKAALVELTHNALKEEIAKYREMMGEVEGEIARYVIEDENGNLIAINPYTNDQIKNKKGVIYQVDFAKNLLDEGNGIKTPIYTDARWSALASALYNAEAVDLDSKADDARLDAAISALNSAYEALERRVYFTPYEFEGHIYYMAISNEKDTYGKWYTSDFKRIVADLKILELDAGAEAIEIAYIDQTPYISNVTQYADKDYLRIDPSIKLYTGAYPELSGEVIKAIGWSSSNDNFVTAVSQTQIATLTKLVSRAEELGITSETSDSVASAESIVDGDHTTNTNVANIKAIIANLEKEIADKEYEIEQSAIDVTAMTADQLTVLNAAIEAAIASDQYNEKNVAEDGTELETYKYQALRDAVADAQTFLQGTDLKKDAAYAQIESLNTQLTAAGLREYTEDNYIQHYIPVTSEVYEVVYDVDSPTGMLYLATDKTDTTKNTIRAVVLTENGVVFTLEKTVEVYSPAEGAEITASEGYTYDIAVNGTGKYKVDLKDFAEFTTTEDIMSYRWSSSDVDVFTVSYSTSEACTVHARKEGTATLMVTVETVQGNVYTAEITITVDPAPDAANP